MAPRKTVARWFTDWLCMRARFAQPQPRGSGSAWCLQQTRIRTVCAGCCYLTDGLGGDHPSYMCRTAGDRRHSQHGRPAAKGSQLEYTRPRRACNDKLNIGRLDETTSPDEHASSHGIAGPGSSFGPWFILIASQLGVSSHRSFDLAVNSKGRENQH